MQAEYDFSAAVRGKYARRYAEGTNVVVLDPDVARVFPNAEAVNSSLRALAEIIRRAGLLLANNLTFRSLLPRFDKTAWTAGLLRGYAISFSDFPLSVFGMPRQKKARKRQPRRNWHATIETQPNARRMNGPRYRSEYGVTALEELDRITPKERAQILRKIQRLERGLHGNIKRLRAGEAATGCASATTVPCSMSSATLS